MNRFCTVNNFIWSLLWRTPRDFNGGTQVSHHEPTTSYLNEIVAWSGFTERRHRNCFKMTSQFLKLWIWLTSSTILDSVLDFIFPGQCGFDLLVYSEYLGLLFVQVSSSAQVLVFQRPCLLQDHPFPLEEPLGKDFMKLCFFSPC